MFLRDLGYGVIYNLKDCASITIESFGTDTYSLICTTFSGSIYFILEEVDYTTCRRAMIELSHKMQQNGLLFELPQSFFKKEIEILEKEEKEEKELKKLQIQQK